MSVFKPKVDTSKLPHDVMSYQDDKFYSLVESLSSELFRKILKCQAINSINTFLHTRDVLQVLQLPARSLDVLRGEACYLLDDNTHVVLPGIVSSTEYITELFRHKNIEHIKSIPKQKRISSPSSSPSTVVTTTDFASNSFSSSRQSITLTSDDHRAMVTKTISKWATSKEKELAVVALTIEEGTDYTLTISPSSNSATFLCHCGTKLSISKANDQLYFNLSNYYRHVQSMKCNLLQKKMKCSRSSDRAEDDVDNPGDAPIDCALPPASTQSSKRSSSTQVHKKRRRRL